MEKFSISCGRKKISLHWLPLLVTKHYPHHLSYIHINLWMYEITIYSIQMSIYLSYYFSYNLECNLKQYSKSNKNLTENKYFKYSLPQKISCFTIYRQSFITWSIYGEYSSLPKVVNVYDLLLIGYLYYPTTLPTLTKKLMTKPPRKHSQIPCPKLSTVESLYCKVWRRRRNLHLIISG